MASGDTTLRVASYNTRDFLDDRRAAADIVRQIDPDILCLQEVPRRFGAVSAVRAFAAQCGLTWPDRHRGSGGVTIFVRPGLPVGRAYHARLPVRPFQRRRGYAVVQVAPPGCRPVTAVSVHLALDAGVRVRHTGLILQDLAGAHSGGPLIIAGDINEGPDGRAWRALAADRTLVTGEAPTFPTHHPQHLLDAIFASVDLIPTTGRDVVLDPELVRRASDHYPIWVDLILPTSGPDGG